MKRSAGLLPFRRTDRLEVLLAHPGGPWWANKDVGAWSIVKGEYDDSEAPLLAAVREFFEETGWQAKDPMIPLGEIRQRAGKRVSAWAFEGDFDPATLVSNPFTIEWPPRSGRTRAFPEVDRASWFRLDDALARIHPDQRPLLERLAQLLAGSGNRKAGSPDAD